MYSSNKYFAIRVESLCRWVKKIQWKFPRGPSSVFAVTSVLETLLLLSMTIGFFSIIYLSVFGFSFAALPPSVHILATTTNDAIVLYHQGGDSLTLDSRIVLKIDNVQTNFTVGDCLDAQAQSDSRWNMGERLVIQGLPPSNHRIEISVINSGNNAMVFHGTIQSK